DADDLAERFRAQCEALESVPDVQGWCWTELADVQQEVNGLLRADRTPKIPVDRLRAVIDTLPWSRTDPSARANLRP
ncbi:MAG: hypothetical protein JST73_00915, partial [Actinobacteria bacterium]|nr:hypothetical protein [Actinomycetota bacterium]